MGQKPQPVAMPVIYYRQMYRENKQNSHEGSALLSSCLAHSQAVLLQVPAYVSMLFVADPLSLLISERSNVDICIYL